VTRQPFPLQWPAGWKRTPFRDREVSRFVTGMQRNLKGLYAELARLGAANVVITSDLPTRSNGQPYGQAADSGIAVWFVLGGMERVIACDRWDLPAENIRAITLTIESVRGMERWGATDVTRAFAGFTALPAGDGSDDGSIPNPTARRHWRDVLAYKGKRVPDDAPLGYVRRCHRQAMRVAHPDSGGSHEMAVEVGAAMAEAEAELGERP
jgi:hypothetical protein